MTSRTHCIATARARAENRLADLRGRQLEIAARLAEADADRPVPDVLTPQAEAELAAPEPEPAPDDAATAAAIDEFYSRAPGTAARLYAELAGPDPAVTWEAIAEAAGEWDCFDSAAYMDRVEAGLEPEAE